MTAEIKNKNENAFADTTETTEESEYKVSNSSGYPFINMAGDIKIGLAVTLKDNEEDLFGDSSDEEMMIIFDSETGKAITDEQVFEMGNLNTKNRVIPEEIFNSLGNAKKTVTLSKAHKNLKNHIITTIKDINVSVSEMVVLISAIKKTKASSENIMSKIADATGSSLESMLSSYVFKKHLLITGDAGEGKTYIVDKFIKDNGYVSEMIIGQPGLESFDLIGHMVKLHDGTFGWKDGVLTALFRRAQREKVVCFFDEMLRMPTKELNVLVGSLTPDSSGNFNLRTGRPLAITVDGIVDEEILSIPQENFWVVATTNQGAGYHSAKIDEALKDRFRLYRQTLDNEKILEIMTIKLKKHGASAVAIKSMVSLIDKTKEIKATGNIPRYFSIRHLSEAADTATSLKDVKKRMMHLVPNIVSIDSDGLFNTEQVDIITKLIKKTI